MGIALVIAGFGAGGLLRANKMVRRVSQLRKLRWALNFLEKEMSYNYTPLSSAMYKTYQFSPAPINKIFQECSQYLTEKSGVTGNEALTKALKRVAPSLELYPEDIDLILASSNQLGLSDIYEQKKLLSLLQENLKIQEEKAQNEVNSNQKLWSYGGFILGSIIVILLI